MDYYNAPRWSGEFLDCSMPLTFDTYSICSYNCLYCFSYFQRAVSSSKNYLNRRVKWVNIEKVKRMFLNPDTTQFENYIKNRITMQWGGLSDQFDEYEKEYGKTLGLMKFFKEINYPLSFSTKGTWWIDDKRYTDLIRGQKNWHFKISIITLDEGKSKMMERGVDSSKARLKVIKKLKELDVAGITLRLRPFIIGMSNPSYLDLIREAKKNGADSVSTEFLCMESRANERLKRRFQKMSDIVGYDVLKMYRKQTRGSGYLRLKREIKEPFINEMDKLTKELGMRFYVSDAHFKERCYNGSCCGLDTCLKYQKGQFTNALLIAKNKGFVTWDDIKEDAENIFGKTVYAHSGLNLGNNISRAFYKNWSIFDFMHYIWNTPKRAKSPYKYFGGVLFPIRKDKNNNVVYEYRVKNHYE